MADALTVGGDLVSTVRPVLCILPIVGFGSLITKDSLAPPVGLVGGGALELCGGHQRGTSSACGGVVNRPGFRGDSGQLDHLLTVARMVGVDALMT